MTTLEFIHVQKQSVSSRRALVRQGAVTSASQTQSVTCAAHEVFAKIRKREQALLRTATARQKRETCRSYGRINRGNSGRGKVEKNGSLADCGHVAKA